MSPSLVFSFCILLCIASPLTSFAADSKPEIKPTTGSGFQAVFPKEPEETNKVVATVAGNLTIQTIHVEVRSVIYSVSVTEYPSKLGELNSEEILDAVRDSTRGVDGKQNKEEKTERYGLPGRFIVVDAGKSEIRGHIFVSKRKLFQIFVMGSKKTLTERDAETFFNSFELQK
jgi:hypothetical protein